MTTISYDFYTDVIKSFSNNFVTEESDVDMQSYIVTGGKLKIVISHTETEPPLLEMAEDLEDLAKELRRQDKVING